jgi:UDP-glucuronate 4-epimerase
MKTLVTGCAGFIGSHLCERLLNAGHSVTGVDALTDYYDPLIKRANLEKCRRSRSFEFHNCLIRDLGDEFVNDAEIIFHLAAQPGVRASWGEQFERYLNHNVLATQKLVERARRSHHLQRFIYASSSSVYGNPLSDRLTENHAKNPYSPYGVTKLAGEQLCLVSAANYDIPTVVLRLFTVFGPRQRPDMLINRLIVAALTGSQFTLYGDGSQYRDFTYVLDVADAMLLAATAETPGQVFNIAGGQVASVNEVISTVEDVTGARIAVDRKRKRKGDVRGTRADTSLAAKDLGFAPKWTLRDGIAQQVNHVAQLLGANLLQPSSAVASEFLRV